MSESKKIRHHRFDESVARRIRQLYRLDNYHGVLALLGGYIAIALCILLAEQFGWIAYVFAVLIIGSRQRALATLTHEAAHGTLAKDHRLNRVLGTYFSGYLLFMLFHSYRKSHIDSHHGNFGDVQKDSDYIYMLENGVYDRSSRSAYVWNLLISPLLLLKLPSYVSYLVRDRLLALNDKKGRAELLRVVAFWIALLVAIGTAGLLTEFLLYWIIPFFTAYQILGWYIELSEHAPMMDARLDVHMSRNRNSHWCEWALTGLHGESFHLAHHLWPRVPFWRMTELNAILRDDPVYRAQDDACGGIVISSNGAPTVLATLWDRAGQPATDVDGAAA